MNIKQKTGLSAIKKVVFKDGPMTTMTLDSLFYELLALTEVEGWENLDLSAVTSTSKMFYGCLGLAEVHSNLLNINTQNITDMSEMFANCQNLVSADLNFFDMRNVTTTEGMFQNCYKFETLLADQWSTSNTTNMASMFNAVGRIETFCIAWDVSNVTTIENMFGSCTSLETIDLNSWGTHTSNITDMSGLFQNCASATSILVNDWDTSNVTNMGAAFSACTSLREITLDHWNTGNVTNMSAMFLFSGIEHLDLSNFNTEKVTGFGNMFRNATQLKTLNLSSFVIDPSASNYYMFSNTPLYELTLGNQFDFYMPGLDDADNGGIYPNEFYTIEWYLVEDPSIHYDSTTDFAGGYHSSWNEVPSEFNLNKVAGTYQRKGQPISLTLEGNGGNSGGSPTLTTNTFYNYPLSISTTFERTGYNFVQWNGMSGTEDLAYSASQLSNGITCSTFSSVMVFTAQWEAILYTVTFDLSGVAAPPTLAYEDLIPEPTTPYCYGYVFNGWRQRDATVSSGTFHWCASLWKGFFLSLCAQSSICRVYR